MLNLKTETDRDTKANLRKSIKDDLHKSPDIILDFVL